MRIRTHGNPFHFFKRLAKLDLNAIFENYTGILDFEIGFGRGVFLRHYAKLNPEKSIIAVEIREAMVDILNERLIKENIRNVLPVHASAEICMEDLIPDKSLENIFIFHPDPWFKKRHHKRRVINPKLLNLCGQKLMPKGKIYISTDVLELFEDIQLQFKENPSYQPISDPEFWSQTYKTHWSLFTIKRQKEEYCVTYQLK